MKKMKRYEEGGDVDSDIEYTTDEEGNEVAISRKSYASGVKSSTGSEEPAPVRKATPAVTKSEGPHTAGKIGSNEPEPKAAPKVNPISKAMGSRESIKPRADQPASGKRNPISEAMTSKERIKPRSAQTYASGGSVSSASRRADGIAQRGKTKGRVL